MGRSAEEVKRRLERLKTINQLLYDDYQRYLDLIEEHPDQADNLMYSFDEPVTMFSDEELRAFAEGVNTGMEREIENGEVYHKYHNAMLELDNSEEGTLRPLNPYDGNDMSRLAPTFLDLSYVNYEKDSPEYNAIIEKNKAIVEELKEPEKRKEYIEKALRNMLSLDVTQAIMGNDAEITGFCKDHPVEVDQMFIIGNFLTYYGNLKSNYGLEIDENLLNACKEKEQIFLNVGAAGALSEAYTNEFYPFVKGKDTGYVMALAQSLPDRVQQLSSAGDARLPSYGTGSAEKECSLMLLKVPVVAENQKKYKNKEKAAWEAMRAQDMFGPGPLKYIAFDETGKQISFEDAIKVMNNDGTMKSNKVTFVERSPEELTYLTYGGTKPIETFTGKTISFEGFKATENFAKLSKDEISQKSIELKDTLSKNSSRIEKTEGYSEEGKEYNTILSDYFHEMKRVRDVFNHHLQTVSGDQSVSVDNCGPLINKMAVLQKAFLSSIDSKAVRDNAAFYFETLKNAVRKFAGYTQEIQKGQTVKDFNVETLTKPLSDISDCVLGLNTVVEKLTDIPPESKEFLTSITAQLNNLKFRNAPDDPSKDMLGIAKINVIDICYAKYMMPIKINRQLCAAYTSDGQFPKDPVGYDAFKKLKDQIADFDKKISGMYFGEQGISVTKDDYVNIAKALKNVVENGALFEADSPNGQKSNVEKISTVVLYAKDMLTEMSRLYTDIPEIEKIAKDAEVSLAENCKKEYIKEHTKAFSGNVVKEAGAKKSWNRMIALKNQFKGLDTQFQKDRLAMMVANEEYCALEVGNAQTTLKNIEKSGAKASIRAENRMLTREDIMTNDNKVKYMAEVRNDAIMIQLFGIGLINERLVNGAKKSTAEEKFIGGNEMLNTIKDKEYDEKYKYAKGRAEAFMSRRKDIEELNPKLSEDLKLSTKELRESLGMDAYKAGKPGLKERINHLVTHTNDSLGLDYKRISSIIKKGSDEANAFRDQIIAYSDKAKNAELITSDDKMMLFKSARNYLHKKSSIPFTDAGKDRVDSATEVLGKLGCEILSDAGNAAVFNTVRTEMEVEMLRNPKFRQEITSWAKEVIDNNVLQNNKLDKGNPELLAAAELLVFGKAADEMMPDPKKNYIETKLDKPEKLKMITGKVTETAANAKKILTESLKNGLQGLQKLAETKNISKEKPEMTKKNDSPGLGMH